MTNYDESKLPKWAQSELRRLRSQLEHKPERIVKAGGAFINLDAIEYIRPNSHQDEYRVTVHFRSGADLDWNAEPSEIEDWFLYRTWTAYWRWKELQRDEA